MISKTKESGRADLLIRMQPELKQRVEKAARLLGKTQTDWVLKAIEVILHVQELQAKAQTEIAEIRYEQEAKFEEILAALAVKQNLGALATLTARTRTQLESFNFLGVQKHKARRPGPRKKPGERYPNCACVFETMAIRGSAQN